MREGGSLAYAPRGEGVDDVFHQELIDFTAARVVQEGRAFEQALVESEAESERERESERESARSSVSVGPSSVPAATRSRSAFGFLLRKDSPEHLYYRQKVVALSAARERVRVAERETEAQVGRNPGSRSGAAASCIKRNVDKSMSEQEKVGDEELFKLLLADLTPDRKSISRVVALLLDRPEVVRARVRALLGGFFSEPCGSTALVAKLYVISDLLQNAFKCSNSEYPKVWSLIQEGLPEVFQGIRNHLAATASRIEKEALRQRISKLLQTWRKDVCVSEKVITNLEGILQ